MVEIELKAWLDNHVPIIERLVTVGTYVRSYEKTDSYWMAEEHFGGDIPDSGIRVRREKAVDAEKRESRRALVTMKRKSLSGNIEVNGEREFAVSDAMLFEQMLGELGLSRVMQKEKQGWEWAVQTDIAGPGTITAEVSMVKDLGWFLELEILAEEGEELVGESRQALYALLERLNVAQEKVESRSYAALLRERRN